jgi:hypothetical protein
MSEKELITEFLLAAEQGNADGLKSCLAKNVDINATNRQGWVIRNQHARNIIEKRGIRQPFIKRKGHLIAMLFGQV